MWKRFIHKIVYKMYDNALLYCLVKWVSLGICQAVRLRE